MNLFAFTYSSGFAGRNRPHFATLYHLNNFRSMASAMAAFPASLGAKWSPLS
jgi:hypothetical protein